MLAGPMVDMIKPIRKDNPLLKIGNSVVELACPKNISAF